MKWKIKNVPNHQPVPIAAIGVPRILIPLASQLDQVDYAKDLHQRRKIWGGHVLSKAADILSDGDGKIIFWLVV